MEQVLIGGYINFTHDTNTEYNSLVGGYQWVGTELYRAKLVSTGGVLKYLRIRLSQNPGGGNTYTFTVLINGLPSGLSVALTATTSGSDMITEVPVSGGQRITLRVVPTSTPDVTYAYWTCVFESTNAKESLILGGSSNTLDDTDTEYGQVMGALTAYSVTENNYRQVVPTAGTLKNFYVQLSADPGTDPDAYRFTVRLNGASPGGGLVVTITADATTGNDLVNSIAVVAGDVLTMMIEPLNGPSVEPYAFWGMTFEASIDGESIVIGGSTGSPSNAATQYNYLTSYEADSWQNIEANRRQIGQVCTIKKLYILMDGAPGAGKKYTFTLRAAGDTNVVAEVADAAVTGNSGALEDTVANDDYMTLKSVPTGTPTASDTYWGFVCYIEEEVEEGFEPGHLKMTLGLGRMGYDLKTRGGKARRRVS